MISEQVLKAAVAAGIISDAQRQALMTFAAGDIGGASPAASATMPDDEPFELFHGFAEIFVALGILILFAGVAGITEYTMDVAFAPFPVLVISAGLFHYYAGHRRMTLPSIVSLTGVAIATTWFAGGLFAAMLPDSVSTAGSFFLSGILAFVLMVGAYRRYHLPFAVFLAGLSAAGVTMSLVELMTGGGDVSFFDDDFFDLRGNPAVAAGVLLFGLAALSLALRFDMRDPHRVRSSSKTAFWLHILAGPAIVNTVTVTLFNIGGATGHVLTAIMLVLTTFLSLVIDRRSFLTAGLIYIGAVLSFFTDLFGDNGLYVNAMIIGLLVTGLGTWWRGMRRIVMRRLPHFPGKDRLAPY